MRALLVLLLLVPRPAAAPARIVLDLDAPWKFTTGNPAGAQNPSFNDGAWADVALPHTWNAFDGQDGGGNYYRGISWYRRHLFLDTDLAGRQIFLTFDAANKHATVYVNGTLVGSHAGGFTAFSFNVTPQVLLGADNVIAVKVDNTITNWLHPLSSADFTQFGGLHRGARLTAVDPVHISLTDHGSSGIQLRPRHVSEAEARVEARVTLRDDALQGWPAKVDVEIFNYDGQPVAFGTRTIVGWAGPDVTAAVDLTIPQPRLWWGRVDPYLYRAVVKVFKEPPGGGWQQTDELEQPLGLRYYSFDPNEGFLLNGKPYELRGASLHQDRLNKGWAISDADRQQDVNLLLELGATFVRLSHYPHARYTYEQLDKHGLVAWSEIPVIGSAGTMSLALPNAKQQLREMIRQRYNHPSVVCWGVFNELGNTSNSTTMVTELAALARAEDPHRPVVGASHHNQDSAPMNGPLDILGCNKYYGWYFPTASNIGPWADTYHANNPTRAIGVSEYGAGASVIQHQANPPQPVPSGPWHPEEYQAIYHEQSWAQLGPRKYLWCKTVWNAFDFAVDSRNEGDTPGRNDKGLVTYDRQIKKDAYYFYKTHWNPEPLVWLTSRRWEPRTSNVIDVKVYSNRPQIELKVNHVSLGVKNGANNVFTWTGVTLASGSNSVEALAVDGSAQDVVHWTAP